MATLAAIGERCPPGKPKGATANNPPLAEKIQKQPTIKRGPPEALALLKTRPGIDGAPLGSPAAAATAAATASAATETEPAIANAFFGLKPLPQTPTSTGRTASRKVKARTKAVGVSSAAAAKTVGGGREALARTGKELMLAGNVRRVGRGGAGDGGGGEGALSTRLRTVRKNNKNA